jgi:hypothetical protein
MAWPIIAAAAGAVANGLGGLIKGYQDREYNKDLAAGDLAAYQGAGKDIDAAWQYQQDLWNPLVKNASGDIDAYRAAANDPFWTQDPEKFKFDKTAQDYIDPALQYRIQQGVRGLDASAASQGGLFSSGQGRDVVAYGQEQASQEAVKAQERYRQDRGQAYQEYSDYLNNQQQRRTSRLSAQQGLANFGMQGIQGMSTQRGNYDTSRIQNNIDINKTQGAITAGNNVNPWLSGLSALAGAAGTGAQMYGSYKSAGGKVGA